MTSSACLLAKASKPGSFIRPLKHNVIKLREKEMKIREHALSIFIIGIQECRHS